MTKLIYILLDGVADRPLSSLNGMTPLEAAKTPSLDRLAEEGSMGQVYSVGRGIAPESDVAVFSMLGYDVTSEYVGRGVVEAVGSGLSLADGDLALRANFATVCGRVIVDRRAGRDLKGDDAHRLAETVNSGVRLSDGKASFTFAQTIGHRAVLVLHYDGVDLSAEISNTDPAYVRMGGLGVARKLVDEPVLPPCEPQKDDDASRLSALLVNEFTDKSLQVLSDDPVNKKRERDGKMPGNAILLRDGGNRLPKLQSLPERFNLTFSALVDMPVEKGISKLVGIESVDEGERTDYPFKARTVAQLLKDADVVYVHIKGPDEPSHDGDAMLKKETIGDLDKRFFSQLMNRVDLRNTAIAVSSDHSTPCELMAHSDDPVPLLVTGGRVGSDGSSRFTERNASRGSLGTLRGFEVLPTVLRLI